MEIYIAAAALTRANGETLLVRKRGTKAFMQPGGKIDNGETPIEALCRELNEELQITVGPEDMQHVGTFSAPAANEAGFIVKAEIFTLQFDGEIHPQAEIEEATWVNPKLPPDIELAPLTRDFVLPHIA